MRKKRGGRQHANQYSPEYLKTHFRLGAPENAPDPNLWSTLKDEQAHAEAAPLRAAVAKIEGLRSDIAGMNAELKACWSVPDINTLSRETAIADVLTDYELLPELPNPLSDWQNEREIAWREFALQAEKRNTLFTNRKPAERLIGFMTANFLKRGVAFNAPNFWLGFRKLASLGVLVPERDYTGFVETGDIPSQYLAVAYSPATTAILDAAQPQAPQKTQMQIDAEAIEHMDTSTRTGQAAAKALHWRGWSAEVQRMYLDWAENNMSAIWGVPLEKMTSPEIVDWVGEFFIRNNLNPFRADSYDKARVALDWNQVLGPRNSLLQASEKLARSIENSDLSDIEVRQNINRRAAEIAKATAPRLK